MQIIKPYNEMHYLKNWLADAFTSGIFLGGFIYNIDWFKVIGAIGVIVAAGNHIDQFLERRKLKKQNKQP